MGLDLAMESWIWHQLHKQTKKKKGVGVNQVKNFYAPKDMFKNIERQPTEYKKTFTSLITYKGLGSTTYKAS